MVVGAATWRVATSPTMSGANKQEATFAEHGFAPAGHLQLLGSGRAASLKSVLKHGDGESKAPVIAPPRPATASRLVLIPLCRKAGAAALNGLGVWGKG